MLLRLVVLGSTSMQGFILLGDSWVSFSIFYQHHFLKFKVHFQKWYYVTSTTFRTLVIKPSGTTPCDEVEGLLIDGTTCIWTSPCLTERNMGIRPTVKSYRWRLFRHSDEPLLNAQPTTRSKPSDIGDAEGTTSELGQQMSRSASPLFDDNHDVGCHTYRMIHMRWITVNSDFCSLSCLSQSYFTSCSAPYSFLSLTFVFFRYAQATLCGLRFCRPQAIQHLQHFRATPRLSIQ